MIDKKLALAFDFKDAPAAVKDAGQAHRDNWKRLEKANDQFSKWKSERAAAQAAYEASQAVFDKAVEAWDPIGKKNPTPEVI